MDVTLRASSKMGSIAILEKKKHKGKGKVYNTNGKEKLLLALKFKENLSHIF